jgi:hypothetical protein
VGEKVITPAKYAFEVKDISWAGGWTYGDAQGNRFSELLPLKPAPKFNVGDMVCSDQKDPWRVMRRDWTAKGGDPGWYYGNPFGLWVRESAIKPAPKFAVGEWVTHKIWGNVEVSKREWEVRPIEKPGGMWVYSFTNLPSIRTWEADLTAQTPQHKHDCKGCVFLGSYRHGYDWDLWVRPWDAALGTNNGHSVCWWISGIPIAASGTASPEYVEARRRAVARGLV